MLQESKPHFIRKKGENFSLNENLLPRGTYLTPEKISLCAAMGHGEVEVFKPVKVAVIPTGDELKLPGEKLEKGQIFESNTYGISSLISWLGHEPIRYSSVIDNIEELRKTLNHAADNCDVIITSGGVSMGERDFVRKIMEQEGVIDFWRIKDENTSTGWDVEYGYIRVNDNNELLRAQYFNWEILFKDLSSNKNTLLSFLPHLKYP